jgi:hypothetical protein
LALAINALAFRGVEDQFSDVIGQIVSRDVARIQF